MLASRQRACAAAFAIDSAVWPNRMARSSAVRMPPWPGLTFFTMFIGAHRRRPRCDHVEPFLQMREVRDLLMLPLVQHRPRIARHVGDGVLAGQERAIGEPLVHHAVKPVHLVAIAVHRVRDLVGRVVAEMVVLPGHRPKPAHLPEQPLHDVGAGARLLRQELVRSSRRDRPAWRRIRTPRSARRRRADRDRPSPGMRLFGEMARKSALNCSPLPMLTGNDLVGRAGLFQKHRDFMAVRRGPIVQVDHQCVSFRFSEKCSRYHSHRSRPRPCPAASMTGPPASAAAIRSCRHD